MFSIKEIGDLEMPFTAKYVMKHYCSIGRFSDKLYTGVTNENGVEFIELPEFKIFYKFNLQVRGYDCMYFRSNKNNIIYSLKTKNMVAYI